MKFIVPCERCSNLSARVECHKILNWHCLSYQFHLGLGLVITLFSKRQERELEDKKSSVFMWSAGQCIFCLFASFEVVVVFELLWRFSLDDHINGTKNNILLYYIFMEWKDLVEFIGLCSYLCSVIRCTRITM